MNSGFRKKNASGLTSVYRRDKDLDRPFGLAEYLGSPERRGTRYASAIVTARKTPISRCFMGPGALTVAPGEFDLLPRLPARILCRGGDCATTPRPPTASSRGTRSRTRGPIAHAANDDSQLNPFRQGGIDIAARASKSPPKKACSAQTAAGAAGR